MVFLVLPFAVSLPADTSLIVGSTPGFPGSTVALPVTLRYSTNVTAAQFDVAFNPAKVSSGTALLGASFSNHVIRSREVAPGVRRVLLYSLNNSSVTLTNGGVVATVPFTVSPQERVSSGPLTPGSAIVARPDATPVAPFGLGSGTIFVRQVNLLPDGHAQFFLPAQPDERYLIQATTNFVNWVNLSTNLATGNFMDLLDSDAALYPFRFYRSALFDSLLRGQIGGFGRAPDGRVNFRLTGFEGRNYVIQASTSLMQWENISTNAAAGGVINFTDTRAPSFPHRFYRVQSGQ